MDTAKPNQEAVQEYEEVWQSFEHNTLVDGNIPPSDILLLAKACEGDPARLRRCLKRRIFGESTAYILGRQEFCGLNLIADRRAYIPDWDSEFLVDTVVDTARELAAMRESPLRILEVGIGGGSIAITIKKRLGAISAVVGIDIDAAALRLAAENIAAHNVDVQLYESDVFESLPAGFQPDLIYSNPPWGNEAPMHYDQRPVTYFLQMPKIASFALDGRTDLHEKIIAGDKVRGWGAEILLYNGVMNDADVARLNALCSHSRVIWFGDHRYSLLHCRNG